MSKKVMAFVGISKGDRLLPPIHSVEAAVAEL